MSGSRFRPVESVVHPTLITGAGWDGHQGARRQIDEADLTPLSDKSGVSNALRLDPFNKAYVTDG